MSEIRQNILTGEWTIYASNRNGKPYDFIRKTTPKEAVDRKCPFCPGNEQMTPEPLYCDGKDGEWTIRVFPNMYPAVNNEMASNTGEEFFTSVGGRGLHEVVVDTDDHNGIIHNFSVEHIADIVKVIKERFSLMKSNDEIEYVQVFKNCGPDAGASINHSHWQIIGCAIPGIQQMLESKNCNEYYAKNGRCLMCDMLDEEKRVEKRIVAENDKFLCFVPFCGKMAFEVYIVPKRHAAGIEKLTEEEIESFADIMHTVLNKVKQVFSHISYNICFQDLTKSDDIKAKHWYVRILPRIGSPAGYEFGTGTYINHILPEYAAEHYKKLK